MPGSHRPADGPFPPTADDGHTTANNPTRGWVGKVIGLPYAEFNFCLME
jgi:hypothetical protein